MTTSCVKKTFLGVVLLLTGCATPTWTGREFQGIELPSTGNAALYIYAPRTGMPVLGQMSAKIFVDNKAVVTIDEGYFTRFELPPGVYRIHASTDSQMACGGRLFPGTRYPPIDISVAPNQFYFLRYSSHPEARKATTCDRYLRITEQTVAEKELRTLREAKHTYQ